MSENEDISQPSQALLDAARQILVEKGLDDLSVRRVAQLAGCTTMTVYTRFGGKDGLLSALYDEGFDQLAQAQHGVSSKLRGKKRVLALCLAYRKCAHEYQHHYSLMLGRAGGQFKPSPQSHAKAMATLSFLNEAVSECLQGPQKRQRSESRTRQLFAFCHGWVSLEQSGAMQSQHQQDKDFAAAITALMSPS